MLSSFWQGVGGKLAERGVAMVFTPAVVFWMGGLLAWVHGHNGGWARMKESAVGLDGFPPALQVGAVVIVLLTVAASGVVAERLTLPVLRLLEGYWPRPFKSLQRRMVKRRRDQLDEISRRFQHLAKKREAGPLTAEEEVDYIELDQRRTRLPALPTQLMPTGLGNILRAAETRPWDKYGLDVPVCWPRLWLILPEEARRDMSDARSQLDGAVGLVLWGFLFSVWSVWIWWPPLVSIAVITFGYLTAVAAAATYADLLEGTFDMYRYRLYEVVRWEVPASPNEEATTGRELTRFLLRGPGPH